MVKVRKDLTGQNFGRLTVLCQAEDYVNHKGIHFAQWKCKCSCGNPNDIIVNASHLKNGHTQSCGCLNIESHIHYNIYDLSGEYGKGGSYIIDLNSDAEFGRIYTLLDNAEEVYQEEDSVLLTVHNS